LLQLRDILTQSAKIGERRGTFYSILTELPSRSAQKPFNADADFNSSSSGFVKNFFRD
jgi:hypothetical protein